MNQFKLWISNHWPALIPVLLLNIIASQQIYLKSNHNLNPWKGGGFGMFSTISERFFHIHLLHKKSIQCAESHSEITHSLRKITNFPNKHALKDLSALISKKTWVYREKEINNKTEKAVYMVGKDETLYQNDILVPFTGIEIQIFNITFNKNTFMIKPKLITSARFEKTK